MEEALCWGLSFPQLFPQKSCRILYRMKAYITKGFNTHYMSYLCIDLMVKMESVYKITIFGLKMMVKSGLEKIFLKFLHAGDYFSGSCKTVVIQLSGSYQAVFRW